MATKKTVNAVPEVLGLFELNILLVGGDWPWESRFDETSRIKLWGPVETRDVIIHLERDSNIDLVLIDADVVNDVGLLTERIRDRYKTLPIATLSHLNVNGRYGMEFMRVGVNWHFSKDEYDSLTTLSKLIREYIFQKANWNSIFMHSEVNSQQFLDTGLDYSMYVEMSLEERYIIKRLFPNSRRIHIFSIEAAQEPGWSGANVYRVQADDELMCIVKIDTLTALATIEEKFDRLIRPRISQYIGQLESRLVRAQSLGGASYILVRSEEQQEVINIKAFLTDANRVKQDIIDSLLDQLYWFLKQLYVGSVEDRQVRFWAEYYSRVLPPEFQVTEAEIVFSFAEKKGLELSSLDLVSPGTVYNNPALHRLRAITDKGESIQITLHDFEISELDPRKGIIYVQDEITFKQRALLPGFTPSKDLPLLRFKINLKESQSNLLLDPILRKGKKISVIGTVKPEHVQMNILRGSIKSVMPELYNEGYLGDVVNLYGAYFIDPIKCLNLLLWEVGKEDFVRPGPIFSPVIHGDMNFKNILVAVGSKPQMWLIDFADSRYGHIYFDLAKIEAEFRAHVLAEIFDDMFKKNVWNNNVAIRMAMLIEHLLFENFQTPKEFLKRVKDFTPIADTEDEKTWWNLVTDHHLLYWENMLYFLAKLRITARMMGSPEQFVAHYPVALFFQSIATLKFEGFGDKPWAKKLVLICSLIAGTKAIKEIKGTATILRELAVCRRSAGLLQ